MVLVALQKVGLDIVEEGQEEQVIRVALMDQMVKALMGEVEAALTSLPFHWSIIHLVQVMEVTRMEIMVAEAVVSLLTMVVLQIMVCKVWF